MAHSEISDFSDLDSVDEELLAVELPGQDQLPTQPYPAPAPLPAPVPRAPSPPRPRPPWPPTPQGYQALGVVASEFRVIALQLTCQRVHGASQVQLELGFDRILAACPRFDLLTGFLRVYARVHPEPSR